MTPPRQKAFATTTAIILLGLVSVALAIMTAALGTENQRSHQSIATQQLEQLLFAATQTAEQQFQTANQITPGPIPLPEDLTQSNAHVSLSNIQITGPTATVQIQAQLGRYHLSESIELTRTANTCTFTKAQLD